MILHSPALSPPGPLAAKNTITYLKEWRDRKINDYKLKYITTYQAGVPLVSREFIKR